MAHAALIVDPGKSDPFVVFTLNGEKVIKSQTKKTLHPERKKTFTVVVACLQESLAISSCGRLIV